MAVPVPSASASASPSEHARWFAQLETARSLMNDARASISASTTSRESTTQSRVSARRQLQTLKQAIDALQSTVESGGDTDGSRRSSLSEHEKNRRRNIILGLREQRDVLVQRLSVAVSAGYAVSSSSRGEDETRARQPRETEETAVRSNAGLLQLQREVMEEQDDAVAYLERSVGATKRLAAGIFDESELQNRLLEDFDEEVGLTSDEVRNLRQRVRRYLDQRGCCGCGTTGVGWLFLVVILLMIVLVVVLKVM